MSQRPPDSPDSRHPEIDLDRLERRGLDLVRQRRQEYRAAQAATPAGIRLEVGIRDRLRAFFTFRNVSLAVNVVFVWFFLQAADVRSYFVPHPTEVEIQQNPKAMSDPDQKEVVIVRDVVGEFGEREVVWAREFEGIVIQAEMAPWTKASWNRKPRYLVVSTLRYGEPGRLSVWDVRERNRDRQKLWEREVPLAEIARAFPLAMTRGSGAWCNGFAFADLDGDDEPEVAAMFHHDMYFPACLRTFDRDGSVRGTYWNWGYLDAVIARDLDDDGRDEVITSGTNNLAQGGTVILLDADHLSGFSMDEEAAARLAETPLGAELGDARFREGALARIVFPMWHEEVAAYLNANRVHAAGLAYVANPPGFNVKIGLGIPIPWKVQRARARGETLPDSRTWIDVRLDGSLRPTDLIVPDGFLKQLRRAREDGKIGVRADSQEHWQEWLNLYWYHGPPATDDRAPS